MNSSSNKKKDNHMNEMIKAHVDFVDYVANHIGFDIKERIKIPEGITISDDDLAVMFPEKIYGKSLIIRDGYVTQHKADVDLLRIIVDSKNNPENLNVEKELLFILNNPEKVKDELKTMRFANYYVSYFKLSKETYNTFIKAANKFREVNKGNIKYVNLIDDFINRCEWGIYHCDNAKRSELSPRISVYGW